MVARRPTSRAVTTSRARWRGARRCLPPLRGVVHAAGVLDDGVLQQQDWARFAEVLAPKVDGRLASARR